MSKKLRRICRRSGKKDSIICCRGVYLAENTSQAAFCGSCAPWAHKECAQQTATPLLKSPEWVFQQPEPPENQGGCKISHLTIRFTSLFFTRITFTISIPSSCRAALSRALAAATTVASSLSMGTVTVARSLLLMSVLKPALNV